MTYYGKNDLVLMRFLRNLPCSVNKIFGLGEITKSNKSLGFYGEKLAKEFLISRNYKILHTNYSTPFGEIDIIARKITTVIFIEVKTKCSEKFGSPLEAITLEKRKHIIASCKYYLLKNRLINNEIRIDGIGIKLNQDWCFEFLRHIKNIIET